MSHGNDWAGLLHILRMYARTIVEHYARISWALGVTTSIRARCQIMQMTKGLRSDRCFDWGVRRSIETGSFLLQTNLIYPDSSTVEMSKFLKFGFNLMPSHEMLGKKS